MCDHHVGSVFVKSLLLPSTIFSLCVGVLSASGTHAEVSVEEELEKVTICEFHGEAYINVQPVESLRFVRGGLPVDANAGSSACLKLVQKTMKRLCKQAEGKVGVLPHHMYILFGFKRAVADSNPVFPPCRGPSDPQCFDPLVSQYTFQTVQAGVFLVHVGNDCGDLTFGVNGCTGIGCASE